MSPLARVSESPLSEFFQWLDLNRPSSLSNIPVESFTRDGAYVVRADLPGVDPEKDIEVKVDGDVLTIHGERRDEEHENGRSEVRYGAFTRSVRLPKGASADDVSAVYDAGVLEVCVPMKEVPAEPIKIAVQRAATTKGEASL